MQHIIPAIIPQTYDHLLDAVATVSNFVDEIQVDIVDGTFVPFTSWPYRGGGSVMLLRRVTEKLHVEVDLMIMAPERAIPLYLESGVTKVVVHLESVQDLDALFRFREVHPYTLGFSINNDTDIHQLLPYLDRIDYVQLMGIRHIGSQGQPFDTEVLTRITTLKAHHPALMISIDGSVNPKTVAPLVTAGAERLVVGSAIFGSGNPSEAYHELNALFQKSINTQSLE